MNLGYRLVGMAEDYNHIVDLMGVSALRELCCLVCQLCNGARLDHMKIIRWSGLVEADWLVC